MHLLIIGHTSHYQRGQQIVGWGPTVREVNMLSRTFERVTHLACLHQGPAPNSAIPYESDKIKTVLLPPSGGTTLGKKTRLITLAPKYISTILREIHQADVIQIRAPGGLALYAMFLIPFTNKPRWIKFGGNWIEKGITPILRSFEREWLKTGITRSPLTVNGQWPEQPSYVHSFHNPSYTVDEAYRAFEMTKDKQLSDQIRILFAGRLEHAKGVDLVLDVFHRVRDNVDAHLDFLGNGPEQEWLIERTAELKLTNDITFHGWQPHHRVIHLLQQAHFVILPSESEGWPKILSEGMACGSVPIASDVSAIPQVLSRTKAGFALPRLDVSKYVQAILQSAQNPNEWKKLSLAGARASYLFTYEYYLLALDHMLATTYGSSPMDQAVIKATRMHLESRFGAGSIHP